MTNPDDLDQHWRAIAEQLGLEPEPTQASEPRAEDPAHVPSPREPSVKKSSASESSAGDRWDQPLSDEQDEELAHSIAPPKTAELVNTPIGDEAEPREISDTSELVEDAPADEESPRGGRSRRRRRRRSKSPKETEADVPSEEDTSAARPKLKFLAEDSTPDPNREEVPGVQEGGEGAQRGPPHRRGRRKRGATAHAARERLESDQDSRSEAPAKEEGPVMEGLTDEDEDLSKWEVPSWQELIASLYRPER